MNQEETKAIDMTAYINAAELRKEEINFMINKLKSELSEIDDDLKSIDIIFNGYKDDSLSLYIPFKTMIKEKFIDSLKFANLASKIEKFNKLTKK